MERRVLLAIILSFVVLYGYQLLFPSPPDPAATKGGAPAAQQSVAGASSAAAQPAEAPIASVTDAAARDVVVENANVRAVFTTQGAALKAGG